MSTFPVVVNVIDGTHIVNAFHGSKICVNQEDKSFNDMRSYWIGWAYKDFTNDKISAYVKKRVQDGHESIIEHVVAVVEISHVSRAFLQQLARHRLLSLSVQSTRWAMKSIIETNEGITQYILPEELQDDAEVLTWLEQGKRIARRCRDQYKNDVAKYILPECLPTKLLATANVREWRHIYKIRKDPPAMKEFNVFCEKLYQAFVEFYGEQVASVFFDT